MNALEDRLRDDLRALADALINADSAPTNDVTPIQLTGPGRGVDAGHRWGRRLGVAAAGLIIVVAAVGLTRLDRDGERASLVASSPETSGPLFVLPAESSGLMLTNATVSFGELDPADRPIERAVVGVMSGETVGQVALVSVTQERSPRDLDWTTRETSFGEVSLADTSPSWMVAQHRGDFWVSVQVVGDASLALGVLSTVVVGESADIALGPDAAVTIVERVADSADAFASVYTDVDDPTGTYPIAVETMLTASPLSVVARVGGMAEPVIVSNTLGWHVFRDDDPDGQWNGLIWQATPDQIVAVSGHVAMDQLLTTANALEVVDEATWRAALPDATG